MKRKKGKCWHLRMSTTLFEGVENGTEEMKNYTSETLKVIMDKWECRKVIPKEELGYIMDTLFELGVKNGGIALESSESLSVENFVKKYADSMRSRVQRLKDIAPARYRAIGDAIINDAKRLPAFRDEATRSAILVKRPDCLALQPHFVDGATRTEACKYIAANDSVRWEKLKKKNFNVATYACGSDFAETILFEYLNSGAPISRKDDEIARKIAMGRGVLAIFARELIDEPGYFEEIYKISDRGQTTKLMEKIVAANLVAKGRVSITTGNNRETITDIEKMMDKVPYQVPEEEALAMINTASMAVYKLYKQLPWILKKTPWEAGKSNKVKHQYAVITAALSLANVNVDEFICKATQNQEGLVSLMRVSENSYPIMKHGKHLEGMMGQISWYANIFGDFVIGKENINV